MRFTVWRDRHGGQWTRRLNAFAAPRWCTPMRPAGREDGVNGYVWTFSTPTERYFVRRGRDKGVVDEVLGESFDGVLVSDFYAAYNHYPGLKQRCWVHLLRDIHELKALYPEDRGLVRWAGAVRQIYDRAKAYAQSRRSTSVRVPTVRISQPVDAGESTTVTVSSLLKRRDGASSKALPTHRAVHQRTVRLRIAPGRAV